MVGCGDVEAIGSRQRHALAITCVQVASTSVYLCILVYQCILAITHQQTPNARGGLVLTRGPFVQCNRRRPNQWLMFTTKNIIRDITAARLSTFGYISKLLYTAKTLPRSIYIYTVLRCEFYWNIALWASEQKQDGVGDG